MKLHLISETTTKNFVFMWNGSTFSVYCDGHVMIAFRISKRKGNIKLGEYRTSAMTETSARKFLNECIDEMFEEE